MIFSYPVCLVLLPQDGDTAIVTFTCNMTIPLTIVGIGWFFETGNSTGFRRLYPNISPYDRMFTATTKIVDLLSNFTFGPVRSLLSVRNVNVGQEGIYSCASGIADPAPVDSRIFQGCLFVLGKQKSF